MIDVKISHVETRKEKTKSLERNKKKRKEILVTKNFQLQREDIVFIKKNKKKKDDLT